MAWASKGNLGATADKTTASSITHTTITTNVAVGDIVIVVVAKDNVQAIAGIETNEVTDVQDSAGNTYTKIKEWCHGRGAANAGAVTAAFYSKATSALSTGGTITANFSSSIDAKAISAHTFTGGTPTVQTTGMQTTHGTNTDLATLTVSGLASAEYLFLHYYGVESNAGPAAGADSFTELQGAATSGAGSASNMYVGGRWHITTGTEDTSNPGVLSNADHVTVMVALSEADSNLSRNVTAEGLKVADSLTAQRTVLEASVSESAKISESLSQGITPLLATPAGESLKITDTPTAVRQLAVEITAEGLRVADTVTASRGLTASLTDEGLKIADTVTASRDLTASAQEDVKVVDEAPSASLFIESSDVTIEAYVAEPNYYPASRIR